jgi:hypothetical protein
MMDAIDWYDRRSFKTWNYVLPIKEVKRMVIDAIAVLLGDYGIYRKKAAILLLKMLLRDDFFKFLFENVVVVPFDRNDSRVRKWTKEVLKKGECELCGARERLEAHHIIKWADYPPGRIDVKNGMCLCHECHTNEHREDRSYFMMKAKSCKKR